ncbi:aldo/keto reductase [Azonexus hydrophilus]|uniref:aldo/keto reductase n=1 Tax=Azonexus hydrophilus TaxID=418702 RepID=UPI00040D97C4|nr:aldo/keto reductase [Azonexus hydrophilus]
MKTLLLGGNRFVGVEMAWQLLQAGHQLTVLALDSPPADLRPHIRWLRANRDDEGALVALFAGESFDCVVDNIAYVPEHMKPTLAALRGRIGRYLLTGTTDVYPHNHPRSWREEEVDIRDYDLTGLSGPAHYNYGKRSCQALLEASGVAWTVLRPCVVTGPRDNRTGAPNGRSLHWFESGSRSHFWASRIRDGGPILLAANDETLFNLVWVGDVARAAAHLLSRDDTVGEAYNVVGDEVWTNERLVKGLAHAAGITPELVHLPMAEIEAAGLDYFPVYGTGAGWTLYENAKLKSVGWQPTPAADWLPRLLEADPEPVLKSWYHTRLAEIALAKKQQRERIQAPSFASIIPPAPIFLIRHDAPPIAGVARVEPGRIGVGTWMGDLSAETDRRYVETLVHAATRGLNVFDTAINYRHMKAERCVGAALRCLTRLGIPREALLVCSKGGYITHDADAAQAADAWLREHYLLPGLIDEDALIRRHCITPEFIAHQLEQSRSNLGLETLDIYYLHNPEDDLETLGEEAFYRQLGQTFVVLEEAVAAGKIATYGLATWDGLRVSSDDARHLSLERAVTLAQAAAKQVGVSEHHLAAVQLPCNVRDHQSYSLPTQRVGNTLLPAIAAAERLGMHVFTSASVLQGHQAPARLEALMPGLTATTAALGAVVSMPGVGTALVGMRSPARVEEAMALLARPLLDAAQLRKALVDA